MDMLLLGTRLILALVFAVAGITKLADRPGFEKTLVDFGVPLWFAKPAAMALPFAEFTVALLMIFRSTTWWGALAAFVLLLSFTIAIADNLWKGRRPDCNCFGQLQSAPISGWTLARNGILLLIASFVAWRGPDQPGLNSANLFVWLLLAHGEM